MPQTTEPWGQYQYNADIMQTGVNDVMAATLFGSPSYPSYSTPAQSVAPAGSTSAAPTGGFGGEPAAVWIVLIVLLVALKIFSEHPGSKLNPAYIKVGGYNLMAIGLASATFFIAMKVIAFYVPVPGFKTFSAAL